MMDSIIGLITMYASLHGLDPMLALSVASVESNLNPAVVGEHGEIGLFQLRPEHFRVNKKDLFKPKVNAAIGVAHLAKLSKECKYKQDNLFVLCHNLGISGAAKLKHPKQFPYYRKVMSEYNKFKEGQRVIVLRAFANGSNGVGVIVRQARERPNIGKWLVDLGDTVLPVEEERIILDIDDERKKC